MKKLVLSLFLLSSVLTVKAQTILFEDSFETYTNFAISNVGNWTLNDVDQKTTYGFQGITFTNSGSPMAFIVFNSTATTPGTVSSETSNWSARTGEKVMACFAATSAPWNNDWLISPQITLGTEGNVVSFWAKSCDALYGNERFKVGISTTGTTPANFTIISPGSYVTTPSNAQWVEYTYQLDPSYANQQVYIGINCISQDQFGFAIDDFKVTTTQTASNDKFFKENFALYPNPVLNELNISITNSLELNEITIFDLTGRKVKTFKKERTLNVSDLASGTYTISIKTNEGTGTSKFIKK